MSSACFFFFNDTATTEIYTLSLHDALPILAVMVTERSMPPVSMQTVWAPANRARGAARSSVLRIWPRDRKSTRLNSSHANISYAVFCLKKKKIHHATQLHPIHTTNSHTHAS